MRAGEKGFVSPRYSTNLFLKTGWGKRHPKGSTFMKRIEHWMIAPQFYANPSGSSCDVNMRSDELISKRLLYSILNGAIYSAQRGICSMEDLDFGVKEVLLMKEGPFTIMNAMGEKKVREDFDFLSGKVGKRFKQPDLEFMEG